MLVSRVLRSTASSSSSSLLQAGLPQTLYFVDGNLLGNVTSERPFGVMEPRSGKKLVDCYSANEVQINEIVHSAKRAFPVWRDTPYAERAQVLLRASQLIRDRLDELARWETLDGGKPITEARADIASCADCFQYFAGVGSALAGEHIPIGGGRTAWTQREPLGVVAAVGAWNYPMQTASWKIAPALACGNSVVYKPSPLAPITAVALATLLTEAGLPPGVLNVVQGDGTTGEALVSHSDIAKVTFTGSFTTGQHILTACARRGIRPATMELGGKGSLIVLEDADVEMAVAAAMAANFYSQGQVCSNASKVLVARNLIEPIKRRLVELTSRLKVGDPLQEDTQVGAHISSEHRDKVLVFINDAISDGAKKLCGGEKIAPPGVENGFYLSPCILTDVSPSSRAFRFEIFGAVLMLIPFDHLEEAIECANATRAGLAHGVVTNNLTLAHQLASRLRAGTVYINTYNDVSSLVPFGGVDDAGFGRENGAACLSHFTNLKSVFLNHSGRLDNAFDKSQS